MLHRSQRTGRGAGPRSPGNMEEALELRKKVCGGEEEPCFAFFLKKEFVGQK